MLIDLVVEGREALIVGGGKEPEFKALKLLDGRARTTVFAKEFTPGLRRLASRNERLLRLVRAEVTSEKVRAFVEESQPRVAFISTGDSALDEELAEAVRSAATRAMVCVVDDPRLNDFNMPAIAKLGDIRVGVSTGGKSPAMAGILRTKIEKAIPREDVLQVRLQGYIRKAAKEKLKDAASRKEFVYEVIEDKRVAALLKKGDYPRAKRLAERMLREASGGA
jgi:precorrin-2 dehydrogenase / sirohydrochlorin ferrochelatase